MNSMSKSKLKREVQEKIFSEDMEIKLKIFKNLRCDIIDILKKNCLFLEKNIFINVKELTGSRLLFRFDVVIDEIFEYCDF